VLRRAAREPRTLFVAVDSDAAAMEEASRRGARPPRRGGRPNVIFLVAAAETLPGALTRIADEVTVILPWGSLLIAVLRPDSTGFAHLGAVLKPNAPMTVLVSAQERDQLPTLDDQAAEDLAARYTAAGFEVSERRLATRADVELLSSGWGRRLGIPERRPAWLFRICLLERA
jgi:16S rRNA (adenine(1408)-N(1))-methyltransferase